MPKKSPVACNCSFAYSGVTGNSLILFFICVSIPKPAPGANNILEALSASAFSTADLYASIVN